MAATDSEIMSQGEVQSSMQSKQHQLKNHGFPPLGRQSSIYSLTLDEFQHTLCDGSKNFVSMNMDEFLSSIWTAEEHQVQAQGHVQPTTAATATTNNCTNNALQVSLGEGTSSADHQKGIAKQPCLSRQGSLTVPPPLCSKTVDEVWAEIHKTQRERQHSNGGGVQHPSSTQRQATFGEMTLEDFLVKAGIVREPGHPPPPPSQPPQPYGMYQNGNPPAIVAPYASRPIMALPVATAGAGPGVNVPVTAAYQPFPQAGPAEASGYPGGMRRAGVYAQQPPAVYGARVGNGTAGTAYGPVPVQDIAMGSPVSPVSSDGICANQMDGNPYGLDMGRARGSRKRNVDGPIEKVVERRQRRMIKNRESAARSRARKQAYTVELEAELNQLKEENAHLKQALQAEIERKRKQQYLEEVKMKAQSKAQKANEKLPVMRRTLSFP